MQVLMPEEPETAKYHWKKRMLQEYEMEKNEMERLRIAELRYLQETQNFPIPS